VEQAVPQASTTVPARAAELGHDPIRTVRLDDIRPSQENDEVYRPVDPSDPQMLDLAESVLRYGVQEPLLVTGDGWIVSGHRRYAAARLAGLEVVPCRVAPIRKDADHDAFMTMLVEHNRQRVKSFDEKLREQVATMSPSDAYESLRKHRRQRAEPGGGQARSFEIVGTSRRAEITKAKRPMLDAVRRVLAELREFHPLSARQIHYALLNDPPLRHASKPGSTYRNDGKSYKSLLDLLTRARLDGLVPMHQIADETRPVETWSVHKDVQDYIRQELGYFLLTYRRDLLVSQPNHIELVAEKNTVAPIVMPVARDYCIPTTIGRGYCSLPPRYEIARRFRDSGKQKLVLLMVTDFDPDGEEIAHSMARSLRDDFGIDEIAPVKVALTADQVKQFHLPPKLKAKKTSTNYDKFVARHGDDVFELEALPPEALQLAVREAIDQVVDIGLLNHEIARERREQVFLANARRRVRAAMAGQIESGD